MLRRTLVVMALLLPLAAGAQFKLPEIKVPGVPGVPDIPTKIPIQIPGLDRIFQEGPALTTSLDDVHTDIPFLDDFDPQTTGSLEVMPRAADNNLPVVPGAWRVDLQSYCLHAGTHGPGGGDGYGYAPLAGPLADPVRTVLKQSVVFPDISQYDIQSLIWALIARAKISDLSPELRDAAHKLLTPQQISKLDGGALAKIPAEFRDQVMGQAPEELRQILNAEATLRDMLTQAVSLPFDELERVAVLDGDPEPPPGSRPIPEGRWSYHPDGIYVRFVPEGYSLTHLSMYVPERILVQADGDGRITLVRDLSGNTVELQYSQDVAPLEFSGNSRVKGFALQKVSFTTPNAASPDDPEVSTVEGRGWVLAGESSGKGRLRGDVPEVYAGAEEMYKWASDYRGEMERLAQAMGGDGYSRTALQHAIDLGQSIQGLKTTLGEEVPPRQMELLYRAWATEMAKVAGAPTQGMQAPSKQWGVQFASLSDLVPSAVSNVWPVVVGRTGYGGSGYDSSGGVAAPGNRGRQRLGQSNRKSGSQGDRDRADKANKTMRYMNTGVGVAWRIGTGGGAPWAIPGFLVGKLIDRVTDLWHKAADALKGDPPRGDYDQIATVDVPTFPPASEGPGASPERVAAANALAAASVELLAKLRAANITLDRYGGALQDDALEAAQRQLEVLVSLEHSAGASMFRVADCMDALRQVAADEGYNVSITADDVRAYQDDLRANGWDADSLRAAEILGATQEELDWALQSHLETDPEEIEGEVLYLLEQGAMSLRDLAELYSAMPNPGMPE